MKREALSVLVVEDHPTIARQLVDFLDGLGWQLDHAATGSLAVRLATQHPYDVVLLDLNLPDMDGLQVCRAIKAQAPSNVQLLCREHPHPVSRSALVQHLWGANPPDSDALKSHIYTLRKTLEGACGRRMLATILQLGYRLELED